MTFRILVAGLLLALLAYTAQVISMHGWDFVTPFFGAIATGDWQGQFNADFLILLVLLALWAAWLNGFTASGLIFAVLGLLLGAGFLTAYLLYLSWTERGDIVRILVGDRTRRE